VDGVVVQTEYLSHFIEEFGLLTSCHVRHRRFPSWCPEIADHRYRANLPDNPANIILSGLLRTFDTAGEVSFAGMIALTNPVFRLVLKVNRVYFRLRQQYQIW
jgi:hypothetical protein